MNKFASVYPSLTPGQRERRTLSILSRTTGGEKKSFAYKCKERTWLTIILLQCQDDKRGINNSHESRIRLLSSGGKKKAYSVSAQSIAKKASPRRKLLGGRGKKKKKTLASSVRGRRQ